VAKGKCGEQLAKQDLHNDGYTEVVEVQNKSGHGVDLVGRNANGDVRVLEVKTTDGAVAPPLQGAQAKLGGEAFTNDRLARAAGGSGHYANSPDATANAMKVQDWKSQAAKAAKKIEHFKHDVFIEDINKGCIKRKDSVSTEWTARTPRVRK
jgi:Holliday junction resolvase-like predicted endonuclease